MLTISNIKYKVTDEYSDERLKKLAARALNVPPHRIKKTEIIKKSIDARDKENVHYIYSVNAEINDEDSFLKRRNVSKAKLYTFTYPKAAAGLSPVVAGFGPAGMLSALTLAKAGLKPIVIERGRAVEDRQRDIDTFWQSGRLDPTSNVQFGEGGAGTFSDGKLTTGKNDPLIRTVFEEFVAAGAPREILYLAKPHIGTDNLRKVVKNIRLKITELGGRVLFEHRLTEIHRQNGCVCGITCSTPQGDKHIDCSRLILAPGHSARDTFAMLIKSGIAAEQKPFAMGVRIEHDQSMINRAQYGKFAKYLPPADYKLVSHLKNGRSIYTFCMCPGGFVVGAASETEGVVTNGMSYFDRSGKNANAALLVGIEPKDFDSDDPLAGIQLQRELEHRAYIAGGKSYSAPCQLAGDLLRDRATTAFGSIEPTYRPAVTPSDMKKVFPDFMYDTLKMGITELDRQLRGFASPDAVLTAVESRSSSPVRIVRDSVSRESISLKGLYPCGEGCGYAGGIVSAAVDGMKCALNIIESL